jgi:anti-sigma B factor antagonist
MERNTQANPRLRVDVESDADVARVEFDGELDLATVGIAEEAMQRTNEAETLVLDLRNLTFLDSSGLRLILMCAERESPRVFVVRGSAQVSRVFELTGAGERLNLIDDPSLIDAT